MVYRYKQLSQKELGVHDKAVGKLNNGSERTLVTT